MGFRFILTNSFRLGVLGGVGQGGSLVGDQTAREVVEGETGERWWGPWVSRNALTTRADFRFPSSSSVTLLGECSIRRSVTP